jgi:hypothetical protein
MLLFAGTLLLALGLLSGAVLVLAPLGILAAQPGLTLWAMFPSLCIAGFVSIAIQARTSQVRVVCLASSALLLVLALASIAALVLGAAALIPAPAYTSSLWYVLVVGAVLGSTGAASFGRAAGEP